MTCHAHRKWASDSLWLGKRQGVATPQACLALCNASLVCTASLHNRYGVCYLLRGSPRLIEDKATHKSVACQRKHTRPPMWRTFASFLASGDSASRVGQRTFHAVLAAPPRQRLPFDVYLLNLDRSARRLAQMRAALAKADIQAGDWLRVPAHFGAHLDMPRLTRSGFVAAGQSRNNVGCAWSHYAVWAALAERGMDGRRVSNRSALILEDDAILLPHFVSRVSRVLRWCESLAFDLCSLTWYRHLTQPSCLHKTRRAPPGTPPLVRLACSAGLNTGMAAYLISPAGVRRALELGLPMHTNIDLQLGKASNELRWFGVERQRSVADHNFSVKSVRVHGAIAFSRRRRA